MLHFNFVLLLDPIDIVKDYIPPHEYLVEEDPKLYQSVKTKRGPLSDDWIEEINQNPRESPVMCAYKLCKVEFRYWGMQSKIERFIHDVGKSACLCDVCVLLHKSSLTSFLSFTLLLPYSFQRSLTVNPIKSDLFLKTKCLP